MKSHEDQEEEDGDNIDVIGLVKGENGDGKTKLKERLNKNLKNQRNIDVVDNIYNRAEKLTIKQITSQVIIDPHGNKHRLKDKTLAEENIEKIEERVEKEEQVKKNFQKHNIVTDLNNKAFVIEESKVNQEKLKGRFDLRINHELHMKKKIEMLANDQIAFFLHKNRNFIYKLKKA